MDSSKNVSSLLPRYPPFNQTVLFNDSYIYLTTCVGIEFSVGRDLLIDKEKGSVKDALLIGDYTGAQIGTQIKSESFNLDP